MKRQKNGFGIVYFKDGAKYIGQIDENLDFNGKGVYTWRTEDKFEGSFYKGFFHGFGVYQSTKGEAEERKYNFNIKI